MKMIFSCRGLIVPLVVILQCFVGNPNVVCQSVNSKTAAKLRETEIIPKLGQKSECTECSTDTFKLSPDGIYLAHMQTDPMSGVTPSVTPTGPAIEVRETQTAHIVATFQIPVTPHTASTARYSVQTADYLQYCDSGKYILALSAYGKAYVLDTKTYQQHTIIDLLGQLRYDAPLQVSCAANGPLVVLLADKTTRFFNLDTGNAVDEPNEVFSRSGIDEVVLSPSGNRAAILEDGHVDGGKFSGGYPWKIVVVDLQKDAILSQINLGGIGENPFAPPVMFAKESMIAMTKPFVPSNYSRRGSLHVWNVETGLEVQAINDFDPSARDVSYPGLSADGHTALIYTAKWRSKDGFNVKDARFFLWDREAGRMIASPQSVKLVHHGCPIIRLAPCNAFDEMPDLALSQSGNAVVAWWAGGGEPVVVYALAPQVANH